MPRSLRDVRTVAVDPLELLLKTKQCAVLPSVVAPTDLVCYGAVANYSNRRLEIPADVPVAEIAIVAVTHNFPSTTAAVAPQQSLNEKLCKVLRDLHVNTLFDSSPHNRPLISLVCE